MDLACALWEDTKREQTTHTLLANLTGEGLSGSCLFLKNKNENKRFHTRIPPESPKESGLRAGKVGDLGRGGMGARSGLGDKVEGQSRQRDRELAGELRQRQVPAESGRRCRHQARRGRPGVTSASRSRARRRACPQEPGARASPPPAEGAAETVAAAAERQHPLERRPRLCSCLPLPGGERRRPPPAPPPVRPQRAARTRAPGLHLPRAPGSGGRGEEKVRETGARETPSPGLHSARRGTPANTTSPRAPCTRFPSSGAAPLKAGLSRAVSTPAPSTAAGPRDSRRPSAPRALPGPRRGHARAAPGPPADPAAAGRAALRRPLLPPLAPGAAPAAAPRAAAGLPVRRPRLLPGPGPRRSLLGPAYGRAQLFPSRAPGRAGRRRPQRPRLQAAGPLRPPAVQRPGGAASPRARRLAPGQPGGAAVLPEEGGPLEQVRTPPARERASPGLRRSSPGPGLGARSPPGPRQLLRTSDLSPRVDLGVRKSFYAAAQRRNALSPSS